MGDPSETELSPGRCTAFLDFRHDYFDCERPLGHKGDHTATGRGRSVPANRNGRPGVEVNIRWRTR